MALATHIGPMGIIGQPGADPKNDVNPSAGPSYARYGWALYDWRFNPDPCPDVARPHYCWWGINEISVINQVPSTLAANNIGASAVPVTGTPFTLVAASGAGITVGVSITNGTTLQKVNNVLAIDGAMGSISIGDFATVAMWDPTKAISRNVRITSAGNDSTGTFLVSGYDIYGFPMSELITGANAGIASGKKAFKYITSVLPGGTMSGSAITIGTGDVYGNPLRVGFWGNVDIYWNSALITATTGWLAADATSPATTTTGDVRGTYGVQSASDGTKRLQMFVRPEPNLLTEVGLFGVAQV